VTMNSTPRLDTGAQRGKKGAECNPQLLLDNYIVRTGQYFCSHV
jgi:hypothetical protein